MVSAETTPDPSQYTLNEIPGLMRVSKALVDIPINRYSTDTTELMRQAVSQWRRELRLRPPDAQRIFAPDAEIYFITVSLAEIEDAVEHARFMNIPTNLALTDDELDHLLLAASRLLRKDKDFQRLLHDLEADATATPLPSQ
jgi:NTE family protein